MGEKFSKVEEKMECQPTVDIPHLDVLSDEIGDITLSEICENMKNKHEVLKGINSMTNPDSENI